MERLFPSTNMLIGAMISAVLKCSVVTQPCAAWRARIEYALPEVLQRKFSLAVL